MKRFCGIAMSLLLVIASCSDENDSDSSPVVFPTSSSGTYMNYIDLMNRLDYSVTNSFVSEQVTYKDYGKALWTTQDGLLRFDATDGTLTRSSLYYKTSASSTEKLTDTNPARGHYYLYDGSTDEQVAEVVIEPVAYYTIIVPTSGYYQIVIKDTSRPMSRYSL